MIFDVGEHLNIWQQEAKVKEEPYVTPWKHEEVSLKMWPMGAPGWTWLLKNGLIDLMEHNSIKPLLPVYASLVSTYGDMASLQHSRIHTHF